MQWSSPIGPLQTGKVATLVELLAFILILCVLALLAARFGVDSRDLGLVSAEQCMARRGLTWGGMPMRVARRRRWTHTFRHPMAVVLYRVAHWLAPESSRAATT